MEAIGVVEKVYKNKSNMYSLKLEGDNDWYGVGRYPPRCVETKKEIEQGMSVKFGVTERGQFKNCDYKTLKVVAATSVPANSGGGGGGGTSGDARQDSIIFQSVLKSAPDIVQLMIANEAIKLPAKAADRYAVIMGAILEVTNELAPLAKFPEINKPEEDFVPGPDMSGEFDGE